LDQIQFPVKLFYLLNVSGLCTSSGDARRQIQGGAVKLGGNKISQVDWTADVSADLDGQLLQVGKKKFIRFKASA
jgi:tyrosyl-tRNA synthetase